MMTGVGSALPAPGPMVEQVFEEHPAGAVSGVVAASYEDPRVVEFVQPLPRTETGEILRRILRRADVVPHDPDPPSR